MFNRTCQPPNEARRARRQARFAFFESVREPRH